MLINLNTIIPNLVHYGYWIIFPIAVVEGPIISIVTGFLLSLGYFNPPTALLVLIIGDLVGDSMSYAIGRFARRKFIFKYGYIIGIDEARLEKIERYIHKNLTKTFIFGKFAHGLGYFTWIATGMVKVPFLKFLGANAITTLIKASVLITVGYFFGQAYAIFNQYFNYTSEVLLVLFVVVYIFAIRTNIFAKIIEKLD
jgi:membrane protein DedA with SNARE-associated domain